MFREKLPLLGDNVVTVTDNKNRQSESNNVTEAPEAKETKNEAAPKAKLPWTQKIAYGFGEVGVFGAAAIEGFFFSTFLLEVAGLDPFWTGNVLMLGQIWDAVVHPIVGKLSDSTHSKWGRRRPWIFIASFPFALAYFAMWQKVPLISNQIGLFLYYLSAFILMNTSAACISVPYTALTPELATSYDLSTELTSLRMLCCIMYGICVSFVHSVLITAFPLPSDPTLPDYAKGYFLSALLISTVSLLPPSLLVICIRETRPVETTEERTEHESCCRRMIRLFSSIFGTLKEKAFVMAMCSYLLAWSTVNLVQSNLLLFMKYVLKMEDQFKWFILELQVTVDHNLLFVVENIQSFIRITGNIFVFRVVYCCRKCVTVAVGNEETRKDKNILYWHFASSSSVVLCFLCQRQLSSVCDLSSRGPCRSRRRHCFSYSLVISP
jgi:Na+/melibiose symporter-like transporter